MPDNRVLLGKSTNTNLGHSGGKYGLYVSATGEDITTCAKEKVIFNTDNIGFASGAIDVGFFQNVGISSGGSLVQSVSLSVSASSTGSVTIDNLGSGHVAYGTVTNTYTANSNASASYQTSFSGTTSINVSNAALSDPDIGSLTNVGVTGTVTIFKNFDSTAALF